MTRELIVQSLYQESAAIFGCDPAELESKSRHKSVAAARHVAIALARYRYGWSWHELARAFKRDHSTCIHAVKKAKEMGYVLDLEAAAQ